MRLNEIHSDDVAEFKQVLLGYNIKLDTDGQTFRKPVKINLSSRRENGSMKKCLKQFAWDRVYTEDGNNVEGYLVYGQASRAIPIDYLLDHELLREWLREDRQIDNYDIQRVINARINGKRPSKTQPFIVVMDVMIEGIHFNTDQYHRIEKLVKIGESDIKYIKLDNLYIADCYRVDHADKLQPMNPMTEEELYVSWSQYIIRDINANLKHTKEKLIRLERERTNLRMEHARQTLVKNSIDTTAVKVISEILAKLKTIPDIEKMEFREGRIDFTTNDIFLDYEDKKWYLGKYQIRLDFKKGVSIRNLRLLKTSERIHPHSFEDHFCLGGYSDTVGACYLNFDYYTLILTVLEFLRNATDGMSRGNLKAYFGNENNKNDKLYRVTPWMDFFTKGEVDIEEEDDGDRPRPRRPAQYVRDDDDDDDVDVDDDDDDEEDF